MQLVSIFAFSSICVLVRQSSLGRVIGSEDFIPLEDTLNILSLAILLKEKKEGGADQGAAFSPVDCPLRVSKSISKVIA